MTMPRSGNFYASRGSVPSGLNARTRSPAGHPTARQGQRWYILASEIHMRPFTFTLILISGIAAPAQQFKPDVEYILTMPKGEASWFLAAKCSEARWLYLATPHEREVWGGVPAALKGGWHAYQSNKRVHVRQQTDDCAEVQILGKSSQYGWVGGW